jgi:hypothetical protein
MKKLAKIINVSSERTVVIYKNGRVGEWKTAIIPENLREIDVFIEIDESIKQGEYHVTIKEGESFEMLCICPKKCDCQNPPPANWDGTSGSWGISNYCPDHNEHPEPNPDCPVHG